jgi:hypothetical protein
MHLKLAARSKLHHRRRHVRQRHEEQLVGQDVSAEQLPADEQDDQRDQRAVEARPLEGARDALEYVGARRQAFFVGGRRDYLRRHRHNPR